MDELYQNTINTWKQLAHVYHEKFKDVTLYDESYETFAALLDPQCSFLEIGCGPGNVTRWFKQRLPQASILATDVASEMIEEAQKHISGVDFEVLDARELNSIAQKFDAILASFIVPYLTKNDLETFISDVADRLNPNGLFYLSCIEKDYSKSFTQDGSTGHKMTVHYYLEDDVLKLFEKHQFEHLKTIRVDYPLPTGESDTHLILFAHKISNKNT